MATPGPMNGMAAGPGSAGTSFVDDADAAAALSGVVAHYWGYHSFRPLQQEAMRAILRGADSVVVLPTGGGKSLCFQAPALVSPPAGRPRLALVVSPLIALMKDQVDGLREAGVPAGCMNSAQSADERARVAAAVGDGRCSLLYVSPERLVGDGSEPFQRWLQQVGVRFVAIDEAHCISQWGHDFRPEYRLLGRVRDALPGASFHAFTATATARVRDDIGVQLGMRAPIVLVGAFDRPNLTYRVRPRQELRRQIEAVIARHPGEAGIIYCLSRREVDDTAAWLQSLGVRTVPYHAGLSDQARHDNQDAFLDERVEVVVATVAFGMGIDRPDVRFVVHAGAPRSLEHYQQEAGRAGRDGLAAECVLITSPADFLRWRSLLDSSGTLTEANRQHLRDMERYAAATECRHRALVAYFGQQRDISPCGACDWCLGELEPVDDAVTIARKILSCVARTGQRFGAAHIVSVLTGHAGDSIVARGHDALSTFGLLRECPVGELRGYLDQLTQGGFLAVTGGQYPTLQLTEAGAALMRSGGACTLYRQPRRPARDRRRGRASHTSGAIAAADAGSEALVAALRAERLAIARERRVPAYVVFHDATLHALAAERPRTLDALMHVPGIGHKKAESFGARLLDVITRHA